jgi:hypothetical protein
MSATHFGETKINRVKPSRSSAKTAGIFSNVLITHRVPISIIHVGDNIKQTLEKQVAFNIEGKCIVEGYVKPGSCSVVSYSSGELSGSDVIFIVVVECIVCCPIEGMIIPCIVKNITESAGIKAVTQDSPSPVIIYIARDHHYKNPEFSKLNIGDNIDVKVIGQRYELNDDYISVIAELVEIKSIVHRNESIKLKIDTTLK